MDSKQFTFCNKCSLMCKNFAKYMEHKGGYNHLLLNLLQTIVREITIAEHRSGDSDSLKTQQTIEISKQKFEARVVCCLLLFLLYKAVKDTGVSDCRGFYQSKLFSDAQFTIDPKRNVIIGCR